MEQSDAKPRRRFQFTILDTLVVLGLTFLGIVILFPACIRDFDPYLPHWPYDYHTLRGQVTCCLAITAASLVGAAAGMFAAYLRRTSHRVRPAWLVGGVCAGWLLFFTGLTIKYPFGLRHGIEIPAAASCKAFAEAEEIYVRTDYDGDGVREYAPSLQELWGSNGSIALIDRSFAAAEITLPQPVPKCGYFYKVLTAQGPAAKGGHKSFFEPASDGTLHMTGGYAIVACPAEYDVTGRLTYAIGSDGTIMVTDLGPDTLKIVEAMTEYNPDDKWWVCE